MWLFFHKIHVSIFQFSLQNSYCRVDGPIHIPSFQHARLFLGNLDTHWLVCQHFKKKLNHHQVIAVMLFAYAFSFLLLYETCHPCGQQNWVYKQTRRSSTKCSLYPKKFANLYYFSEIPTPLPPTLLARHPQDLWAGGWGKG